MSTYTFFVLQPYAFLAHNIHIIDINNSEYNRTNQRYVLGRSVVPKTPDSKMMLLVRRTLPDKTRFTENLSIYLSPPAPNSPLQILLILARLLPIGYFTFYYFSFFLIFNRMDAWSLMRGDAFIHFVCGSRRINIRLGVLLLIPKSPQGNATRMLDKECFCHWAAEWRQETLTLREVLESARIVLVDTRDEHLAAVARPE